MRQPAPERCFIRFAPDSGPVAIPIGRACHTVVVAHALTESRLMEGGPLGRPVATYTFRAAGGGAPDAADAVAIRERFEIAAPFRDRPFNAVEHQGEYLHPRYEGRWDEAGRRQTEASRGPATYFLWAWRNPDPARVVEELVIEPAAGGPAFIIAGVTTGHVDEHPFTRQGRRDVQGHADRPGERPGGRSTWT